MSSLPEAGHLNHKAADFLLSQRSSEWSWNYWRRGVPKEQAPHYPDDLDDTTNALAALQLITPAVIDGTVLGQVARLLISAEAQNGGPYCTWLNAPPGKDWQDVDPVVNANIGYFLSLQGVSVPSLNNFLDHCLQKRSLTSPYYVGTIPCLYFLSSWFTDKTGRIDQELIKLLGEPGELNAVMLSLVITASCNRCLSRKSITQAIEHLLSLRTGDHWPAEALYLDPARKGIQHFAGSAVLTTAFATEALHAYDIYMTSIAIKRTNTPLKKQIPSNPTLLAARTYARSLPTTTRRTYLTGIRLIERADSAAQVTLIATIAAKAYAKPIPESVCLHLNLASLNGWLAYTIYDDFLDDEGKPLLLGTANIAQRQMLQHFTKALPIDSGFHALVEQALDTVDTANTWEVTHARVNRENNILRYTLPKYGNHKQLAERSQGHMLAMCGVAIASGFSINSTEVYNLRRFFHHFLIAKQLNDDAHDWQEDLHAGHISSVVSLLLKQKAPSKCDLDTDIPMLRIHFWESTVHEVSELILAHLKYARHHLSKSGMKNPQLLETLLMPLEKAARAAASQQTQAKKFIAAYSKTNANAF